MSKNISDQKFGGLWTVEKLDAVSEYMVAFNKVLLKQKFDRVYIDAFAGSGYCRIKMHGTEMQVSGSAHRAIKSNPSFNRLYFIEKDIQNCAELEQLCIQENATTNSVVLHGDANQKLPEILRNIQWGSKTRGLLFLDPFGMNLEIDILEEVAKTKSIDVWYLFPLLGVLRQSAKNLNSVDQGKSDALDRILGGGEWREKFYIETNIQDLLDSTPDQVMKERIVGTSEIIDFATDRLKRIFPMVLEPAILKNSQGKNMFALFFACSNPSKPAQAASGRIAGHLIRQLNLGRLANEERSTFQKAKAMQQQDLFDDF